MEARGTALRDGAVAWPPAPAADRALSFARRLNLPLVAIVAVAFAVTAVHALRTSHWWVMTDELQYVRLSESIGSSLSLVPHIHGRYIPSFAQVEPLLLSPLFHFFETPTAWRLAHALGALVMASTAIPVYLLARDVLRSRRAAWFSAAASVAVPWLALSSMLVTEVPAYPVFAWAALAMYRAIAYPSARRDGAVVAALLLAFFTRPQLFCLAVVLPICILAVELRDADPGRSLAGRAGAALAATWRNHRLLAGAYGLAALLLWTQSRTGDAAGVLGTYSGTLRGALLPHGVWASMRGHLDYMAVALGIVPTLLAAAWAVPALVRPRDRRLHAFSLLLVLLVATLTYQAAAFNVKFVPGAPIQDRYVYYAVPLVFIGMAACLMDSRRRTGAIVLSGVALAFLVRGVDFGPPGLFAFASPDAEFHWVLDGRSLALGHAFGIERLSAASVLFAATLGLTLVAALALRSLPRRGVAVAACGGVLAFCAVETEYVLERVAPSSAWSDISSSNWIDRAVPGDGAIGVVPTKFYDLDAAPTWWDVELWNKQVRYSYRFDGSDGFTNFPQNELSLDWRTGALRADVSPRYLVFHDRDVRFRPQIERVQARHWEIEVVEAVRPYRAAWAAKGQRSDGWTAAGTPVTVRLYRRSGGDEGYALRLRLAAPEPVNRDRGFEVSAGRITRRMTVRAGSDRTASVPLCLRRGAAFGDAVLRVHGASVLRRKPAARVGLVLDRVDVEPDRSACRVR